MYFSWWLKLFISLGQWEEKGKHELIPDYFNKLTMYLLCLSHKYIHFYLPLEPLKSLALILTPARKNNNSSTEPGAS